MSELQIFDLDNTLLAGDSDRNWGIFLADKNIVGPEYLDESEKFYNNYYDGSLDINGFLSFCLKPLVSNDMNRLLELREQFIEEKIKPIITKSGKEVIDKAIKDNKTVIIATATNDFVTKPIADLFNVSTLIATEFEIENNNFTGNVVDIPCFREGKLKKVEKWVQANDFTLAEATFYTDSFNDLPLLEKVKHPIIVDGDDKLKEIGNNNNWKCISFR